jgi:hypothetical protein
MRARTLRGALVGRDVVAVALCQYRSVMWWKCELVSLGAISRDSGIPYQFFEETQSHDLLRTILVLRFLLTLLVIYL